MPQPKENPLKRIYTWMLSWGDSKYGFLALNMFAFFEAIIFPLPPDILLISLTMGSLHKWKKFAFWCTVSSIVGGVVGYALGYFFFDSVGQYIITELLHLKMINIAGQMDIALPHYISTLLGSSHTLYLFQSYEQWNGWIVFVFGLTALPFKLITITSGIAHSNLAIFILAATLSRSLRFFLVTYIVHKFGDRALQIINKYFNIITIIAVILIIIAYALFKYLT